MHFDHSYLSLLSFLAFFFCWELTSWFSGGHIWSRQHILKHVQKMKIFILYYIYLYLYLSWISPVTTAQNENPNTGIFVNDTPDCGRAVLLFSLERDTQAHVQRSLLLKTGAFRAGAELSPYGKCFAWKFCSASLLNLALKQGFMPHLKLSQVFLKCSSNWEFSRD